MYIIRRGLVARLGTIMSESTDPVLGQDVVLFKYRLRRNYSAFALTYVEVFGIDYISVVESCMEGSAIRDSMNKWARGLLMCRLLVLAASDPDALASCSTADRVERR